MSVAQFESQPDLEGAYTVEPETEVDVHEQDHTTRRYRTCYAVELWPIRIDAATLSRAPFAAPPNQLAASKEASAVLRLTLSCLPRDMTFRELAPDKLRFFLRGERRETFPLYELIFNHTVSVALADSLTDPHPVVLGPECLRPVGFESDEGLLPYPARSFLGYRLLTEYFVFPEKFLFFELTALSRKLAKAAGKTLEVFLYLNRRHPELERRLSAANFALGCTPLVNLFRQRAAPIDLTETRSRYAVVPDARRAASLEVYSIETVSASSPDGTVRPVDALYGIPPRRETENGNRWLWHATRDRQEGADGATMVYLSFVKEDFDPWVSADWTVSVETVCLNRQPVLDTYPRLELVAHPSTITGLTCLKPPTGTLRPGVRRHGRWRLLSHLVLNHLSLGSADGATIGAGQATAGHDSSPLSHEPTSTAQGLREILRLYDLKDSEQTRLVIDSIIQVRYRRGIARAPGPVMGTFCHGIDVEIEFDDQRFSQRGTYLLAMVLNRFLALYCSINSFTRLTLRLKAEDDLWGQWAARAGNRVLL